MTNVWVLKLSIYSLKKTLYDGGAKSINCQTADGEITILDGHRPLVSTLKEGVVRVLDQKGEAHYINAKSGFVEVMPTNQIRFIVEE
ncbi:MAG: F0F1 ATP synthase subunit epsilon [Candidatus Portnoybacteria bacterium]|nr:F0F1 ATP synthase subunit epsilon [Candidatus Portnoybacteria bacterium]